MHMEPSPTEPNPLVVFAGSASKELGLKIANYLDIALGKVDDTPFPNGESMIRLKTDVRERDVFVVQSTCRMRYPTSEDRYTGVNDNIIELLVWADTLRRASAYRITAVIPYFGYSRQDRKDESRTPISARLMADLLEKAGFNRILTMDLHADQQQGFFRIPLDHLTAGEIITNHFNGLKLENSIVLSADIGNLKKADKYRQGMPNLDIAVVDKHRYPSGVEVRRIIGDVKGKTVILLDDVISTGSTVRSAIDAAKKEGAGKFYVAATHGELVGDAANLLRYPLVEQLCVTDTIPLLPGIVEQLPIRVLSVGNLIGEAIRRIHDGESISQLLGKFG